MAGTWGARFGHKNIRVQYNHRDRCNRDNFLSVVTTFGQYFLYGTGMNDKSSDGLDIHGGDQEGDGQPAARMIHDILQQRHPMTIATLDATIRSHYTVLYERQRLRESSPSTRSQFKINLDRFDAFLHRPAVLDDLNDDTISDVMIWMTRQELAPRTANKFRDNMLALWRFLAAKHLVMLWPTVEALREPERLPVAWLKPQLAALWHACQQQQGKIAGVPANYWWLSLHAVAWDTGERITALMSLERGDLDMHGCYLRIRAEVRKGKSKDIGRDLHPDTISLLRHIIRPDTRLLFPWDRHPSTLWHHYKKILHSADLPCDREHMFHCLRKSSASWIEAAGGDATKHMDHSSRRVTVKYLDPRICGSQQASQILFRPDGDKPAA